MEQIFLPMHDQNFSQGTTNFITIHPVKKGLFPVVFPCCFHIILILELKKNKTIPWMTQKVQYPLQLIERIRIVARIWSPSFGRNFIHKFDQSIIRFNWMTFHLPLIGTIAIVIVVIDAGSHSCWSYYWLLLLRHSYYVSQNSIGSFSSVIIIMYPKRGRRGSFPTFFLVRDDERIRTILVFGTTTNSTLSHFFFFLPREKVILPIRYPREFLRGGSQGWCRRGTTRRIR